MRFFGRLRDLVGDELTLAVPAELGDSEGVRAWLGRDYPALLDPTVRIALDDRMLVGPEPLGEAMEMSFLPPVSGG